MNTAKERVENELAELTERSEKLNAFLGSSLGSDKIGTLIKLSKE